LQLVEGLPEAHTVLAQHEDLKICLRHPETTSCPCKIAGVPLSAHERRVCEAIERSRSDLIALTAKLVGFDTTARLPGERPRDEAAMHELLSLKDPPSAVFATSNRASVGALRAVRVSGACVALVGFDDFELADVLSVTVVLHDPFEMGRAAKLLLARLAGDDRAPQTIILPTELVVRGSGQITG
jgi:LacI family transcriptional regulator